MNMSPYIPAWLSAIPLGWIIVAVLFMLFTFDAMRSGSGRVAVLVLSSIVSVFLYDLAPHTAVLGSLLTPDVKAPILAGIFAIVFVITYLLIYRGTATFSGISGGLFFSLLAGICGSITLLVAWQQVPALVQVWNFGTQIQTVFGAAFALPWLLLCLVILAFIRS